MGKMHKMHMLSLLRRTIVAYSFGFISLLFQPTCNKLNPQFENAKHLFKIIMPELVSVTKLFHDQNINSERNGRQDKW